MSIKQEGLTAERLREIVRYDPTTGLFYWIERAPGRRADRPCGSIKMKGRRVIRINYRDYAAYRLAWLYVHGGWPAAHIDHKDVDCGNDAFENLRPASNTQNLHNRKVRRDSASGLKGVRYAAHAKLWRARITVNGRTISLGYFRTPEEAHAAYATAAAEHFGEFARAA